MWFAAMHVLTVRTPIGRKVQRTFRSSGIPLARMRRKDLTAAGVELVPRTAGVRDGRPVLEGGQVLDVANVIWCTGFAPDFGWIDLPIFNEDGDPVHDRGVSAVSARPVLRRAVLPVRVGLGADRWRRTGCRACRQPHCVTPADQRSRGSTHGLIRWWVRGSR